MSGEADTGRKFWLVLYAISYVMWLMTRSHRRRGHGLNFLTAVTYSSQSNSKWYVQKNNYVPNHPVELAQYECLLLCNTLRLQNYVATWEKNTGRKLLSASPCCRSIPWTCDKMGVGWGWGKWGWRWGCRLFSFLFRAIAHERKLVTKTAHCELTVVHGELTVTKMVTASRDWAVTWAVIELWPSRDWAMIAVIELWPHRDWAVT